MNDNLKVISDSCFKLSGVETVVLPRNLEKIEHNAFEHCWYLKCLVPSCELEWAEGNPQLGKEIGAVMPRSLREIG